MENIFEVYDQFDEPISLIDVPEKKQELFISIARLKVLHLQTMLELITLKRLLLTAVMSFISTFGILIYLAIFDVSPNWTIIALAIAAPVLFTFGLSFLQGRELENAIKGRPDISISR